MALNYYTLEMSVSRGAVTGCDGLNRCPLPLWEQLRPTHARRSSLKTDRNRTQRRRGRLTAGHIELKVSKTDPYIPSNVNTVCDVQCVPFVKSLEHQRGSINPSLSFVFALWLDRSRRSTSIMEVITLC